MKRRRGVLRGRSSGQLWLQGIPDAKFLWKEGEQRSKSRTRPAARGQEEIFY